MMFVFSIINPKKLFMGEKVIKNLKFFIISDLFFWKSEHRYHTHVTLESDPKKSLHLYFAIFPKI